MSVLRPLLSRRGRLVFVATALLLVGALVAAPGVSGARNAVKQFIASIDPTGATGGVAGSWTETVTNCGGPELPPRCTLSSTIGLGAIRVNVPPDFRPVTVTSVSSPNWTVIYDPATGNINATANGGSFKLQPGESLSFTFSATPAICSSGTQTFTTAAWGSTVVSGTDPFAIQGPHPTVTVTANGACVTSGGTVTGPNGQTETITGDFQGHVSVTFGGDLDCSFDPTFGSQWSQFNLPTQVNITPAADFVAGDDPKISTSRFPTEGNDSSLYLICYAVPKADHPTPFTTRGGGPATTGTVNGVESWVGILPNCYDPISGLTRPEPCVSEQFLDTTPTPDQIVISVRMPPGDPFKR
jgi:hypothetical protein